MTQTPSLPLALVIALALAGLLHGHGNHEERVELYTAKIKRQPDDVVARHQLALAYVENDDWKLALEQLDIADSLKPPGSELDFSVTRGRALAIGDDLDGARQVLDTYLGKHADDGPALLERARIFAAQGQWAPCLADYRGALKLISHPDPDVFLEVAEILSQQKHGDEAIATIQRGIASQGNVPALVLKAMELESAAGHYDAALTRIDTMTKLMPRPEPMLAKRAALLAKAGRHDESRLAWEDLARHIESLPNLERGSATLTEISRQAQVALAALNPAHNPTPNRSPPSP